MSQPCPHRDDVAPYVLDALSADEQQAFADHLATCPRCRSEVSDLAMTVDALPLSAAPHAPPLELKDRIMAVVRSEADLLRAAGPDADRVTPRPRRPLPGRPARRLVAALAAALILGVGLVSGLEFSRSDSGKTRVAAARASLQSAKAHVEISDRGVRLVMTGMPRPPAGHVYEVWLQRFGQAPRPSGTFYDVARQGTTTEDIHGDLHGAQRLLVTVEPKPGSARPTSPPVIEAVLT